VSLWTPDGEHRVPDDEPGGAAPDGPPDGAVEPDGGPDPLAALSPEEREQAMAMAAEMDAVRQQLASVPAAVVVANHAMGLYELAAIHLSADPPAFTEAILAIDAMEAIVQTLQGRLGENEPVLVDALGQLKLAYLQLKSP
jgi:uncharacterized protein with GYD domain